MTMLRINGCKRVAWLDFVYDNLITYEKFVYKNEAM